MSPAIGRPVNRVDGPEKVTGAARYSGEIELPGLVHAAIVGATIPSGPHLLPSLVGGPAPGQSFFPMQDDVVHYAGQPVAIVIADGLERAHWAAFPRRD